MSNDVLSVVGAQAEPVETPFELAGNNELTTFLRCVLPQEGLGAFIVSEMSATGKWTDQACDSIYEIAQRIIAIDADGSDAYIALGVFKRDQSRINRRQEHVVALRNLWLDIDVGSSKPYKTQAEALGALSAFCAAVALPSPLIVLSGSGGLHAHFPLTDKVTRDEWQRAAEMLKSLCITRNFYADAACTSDAARVLRPVQTRNFKDRSNPRPVAMHTWGVPTPFSEIESKLSKACDKYGTVLTKPRIQTSRTATVTGLNAQFMVPETYRPSFALKIAEQCAQIRAFRDGVHQSEPEWHACLALIKHTVESDAIAHKWSALDSRYREEETAGKLARLSENEIGPTTCAKFAGLNPTGCADCPHNAQITSPIVLGHRGASDAKASSVPGDASPVTPPSSSALPPPPLPETAGAKLAQAFGATVSVPAPLFELSAASAGRFLNSPPKPRIWLLKDYLPAGIVGSVIAPGGTGKSQLILQLATSVAAGLSFCDTWETGEPGEVLVLLAEDDEEEIHRRVNRIERLLSSAKYRPDLKSLLSSNLYIRSMVGENNLLTSVGASQVMQDTGYAARIIETTRELKNLKLIVIDPVSRFRGGDENSAEDVTRFIEALERIRRGTGATVLGVHHANKASMQGGEQTQAASRGSSAFSDGIRWQMNLSGLSETEARRFGVKANDRRNYLSVTMTKNNYAAPQPTIYLQRAEGGVLVRATLDDARKGEDIMLRIVEKIANMTPISANQFERDYGGVENIFCIGERAIRGHLNKAIEAGYLSKPNTGREKPLTVTELGHAVISVLSTAAVEKGSTPDSPAIPGKTSAGQIEATKQQLNIRHPAALSGT